MPNIGLIIVMGMFVETHGRVSLSNRLIRYVKNLMKQIYIPTPYVCKKKLFCFEINLYLCKDTDE